MKAVLIFIDGTICDTHPRHHLGRGTPAFYKREAILQDLAVPGAVKCLQELSQEYEIVYLGARPASTLPDTEDWLSRQGFPQGPVYLAATQEERLALVRTLKQQFEFIAGIGDRWDDNELHLEIGCLSIILMAFEGNWDTVRKYLLKGKRERILPVGQVVSNVKTKKPRQAAACG
jgi:hypothetical protein